MSDASFDSLLNALPETLRERSARLWQRFAEAGGVVPTGLKARELLHVFATSEFIAESCIRFPSLPGELLGSGDLTQPYGSFVYRERLRGLLAAVPNENVLLPELRRFRRREMVRIAWRDLAGRATLAQTLEELSALADAAVDETLALLERWHEEQWGVPAGPDGMRQRMVVLGMGKLGARELNYSSDIDLIFCYPEDGDTQGGRRSISNQEFFIRLGQRLMGALDRTTADGYVFRVDLRLRPFGEASALALSFEAMEDYYQVHGREWERYAMVKARVIAGDLVAGEQLLAALRPFVYRRYVDYGAFESLREMKGMIEQEVRRKGMEGNVKLGAGGIREVEFIAQAFQLIRGGREPRLQERHLLTVLGSLRELDLLPVFVVDQLREAYGFLRDAENRIQMAADEQRHELPEDAPGRARLALAMGFPDWESFAGTLAAHRALVHEHFEQVFAAPQGETQADEGSEFAPVWTGALSPDHAAALLAGAGFDDPAEALRLLAAMRESHALRALSDRGRQRLDRLMPLLLGAIAQRRAPDLTLRHLLALVEAIARRTAYLALLVENPMALSQLVRLCSASPWIAGLLTRHPLLLDELLDARSLYHPPRREALAKELRQRLGRLDGDEEQAMEALRQFRQINTLRVAAADVVEAVPLMVVSDHLTELAEVILEEGLTLAWHHLVARHGRPRCGESRLCDTGFAIIAYGKLGGIELGYGSDLDLVFLHDDDSSGRTTDGARPVENVIFYARLAQRLIHVLTARTPSGDLYEVDTRLRPDGASGLLVSTMNAFGEYQRSKAWTWEHQALVRARFVAGDPAVGAAFAALRREVLGRPRDLPALRREVREMRLRMRENLSKADAGGFDLKQDAGGIADIEFMVQYAVLAWAHRFPDLLEFTDNIRLLEGLARNGVIPNADAALLADAYRAYRKRVHRLTLRDLPAVVGEDEFAELRAGVQRVWQDLMETD